METDKTITEIFTRKKISSMLYLWIKEHKSWVFNCTHICFWIGVIQRFRLHLIPQKSRTPSAARKCRFIACTLPWAPRACGSTFDLVIKARSFQERWGHCFLLLHLPYSSGVGKIFSYLFMKNLSFPTLPWKFTPCHTVLKVQNLPCFHKLAFVIIF